MNTDELIFFIKSGANFERKLAKSICPSSGVFFMLSVMFITEANAFIKISFYVMQLISLFVIICMLLLTHGEYTVKKRILINLVISYYGFVNCILFSIIIFVSVFGLTLHLLLIILPPILISCLFATLTLFKLKKPTKKSTSVKAVRVVTASGIIGSFAGLFGIAFAKPFLKSMSQGSIRIFLMLLLVFFACCLSGGINNVLKLYYMKKLKQVGFDTNELIEPGVVYVRNSSINNS